MAGRRPTTAIVDIVVFTLRCQFDTSHSLASLTFIAAQLSTLLYSIAVASSAAASPASLPYPTASPASPAHSPSSTAPPLSNPLALCHSNLTAALSNVLSTSIQLLTLPTSTIAPTTHFTSPSTAQHVHAFPSSSSLPTPPLPASPRFTIRVITDLEPVTPPTSRPPSPSLSTPTTAPSPHPTAVVDVCDGADKSISVATNSICTARVDLSVPILPAEDSNVAHSTPTTTDDIIDDPPVSSSAASPSLPSSHSPTAAATNACNGKDEFSSVATQSVVTARPGSTTSAAPSADSNITTHTQHTTSTRPCTRSTTALIHPFFTDLHSRTGKAAKHFRRLYPPTAAMCECGLFPVYSQQVRSSTSPSIVLPQPFQQLCLDCISGVHSEYHNRTAAGSAEPPGWATLKVPGLAAQIWSHPMYDTQAACYTGYYDKKHMQAVLASAPDKDYVAANGWIKRQQQLYCQTVGHRMAMMRELGKVMEERRRREEQAVQQQPAGLPGDIA